MYAELKVLMKHGQKTLNIADHYTFVWMFIPDESKKGEYNNLSWFQFITLLEMNSKYLKRLNKIMNLTMYYMLRGER